MSETIESLRTRIATLEADLRAAQTERDAALERMKVVLNAGPSTALATTIFDRNTTLRAEVERLTKERAEACRHRYYLSSRILTVGSKMDRLATIIDEAWSTLPAMSEDEMLAYLERRLFADRQERERLRGALEFAVQDMEWQGYANPVVRVLRAALAGETPITPAAEKAREP